MTSFIGKIFEGYMSGKTDTPASLAVKKRNKALEDLTGDAATYLKANRGANKQKSKDTKKNYHQIKNKFKHQD